MDILTYQDCLDTYLAGYDHQSITNKIFVCIIITGVVEQSKGGVNCRSNDPVKNHFLKNLLSCATVMYPVLFTNSPFST